MGSPALRAVEAVWGIESARLFAGLVRSMDDFGDDLLRLLFMACHPVLARTARVALTVRVLGGLTTAEIARVSAQCAARRAGLPQ